MGSRLDSLKQAAAPLLGVIGGFIGGAIGGPAGAVKGATLGYFIGAGVSDDESDAFDPPPSLQPLEFQTSEYNSDIYRAYGDNIIAGNLEWLKGNKIDVIEKGNGQVYAATFAISVQSGAVGGILKIFADGGLIHNAANDTPTSLAEGVGQLSGITVYGAGSANVIPDEIRLAENDSDMPAFRGQLLIVFTDFELTAYQNTIPTFKFVTSDAGSSSSSDPVILRNIAGAEPFNDGSISPGRGTDIENMPWYYSNGVLISLKVHKDVATVTIDGVPYLNYHGILKVRSSADTTGTLYSEEFVILPPSAFFGGILNNDYSNVRIYPIRNSPELTLVSWINAAGYYASAIGQGQRIVLTKLGLLYATAFFNATVSATFINGYIYICTGGSTSIGSEGQRDGVDGLAQIDFNNVPLNIESNAFWLNSLAVKFNNDYDYIGVGVDDNFAEVYAIDSSGLVLTWIAASSMSQVFEYALETQAVASDLFVRDFHVSYKTVDSTWVTVKASTTSFVAGSADFEVIGATSSTTGTKAVAVVKYSKNSGFTQTLSNPWNFEAILNQDMVGFGASTTDGTNINVDRVISEEMANNPFLDFGDLDYSGMVEESIGGYVMSGRGSIRALIKPLMKAYQFGVYEEDYQIKFKSRVNGSTVATIPASDLQAHELGSDIPDQTLTIVKSDQDIPAVISVSHVDPATDYEKGSQEASRGNTINNAPQEVSLPMVLSANKTAKIADILLRNAWLENQGEIGVRVPFKYSWLENESVVTVVTDTNTYSIRIIDIEKGRPGIVMIKGVLTNVDGYSSSAEGDSGIGNVASLVPTSATVLQIIDCIALRDSDVDFGLYYATYQSNPNGNWNGAEVHASIDYQRWNSLGTLINGVTICTCIGSLDDNGTVGVWDSIQELNVNVINGTLETVTETAASQGANICAYGDEGRWEIIKFLNATDEGDGTFTISKLLRGYYGTEEAMGLHEVGDRLVIFTQATWGRLASKDSTIYQTTQYYKATTLNQIFTRDQSTAYESVSEARIHRAPLHLKSTRNTSSDVQFSFFRGQRDSRQWLDVDWTTTDIFDFEIDILSGAGGTVLRTIEITGNNAPFTTDYTSAMQVTDFGSNQAAIYINLYQLDSVTGRGKVTQGLAI